MANPEHLEILRHGAEAWNKWRKEHPKILPDFHKADLFRANFRNLNLIRADLRGADLCRTRLVAADLRGADLSGADLRDADLSGANLHLARFTAANLRRVNLSGANIRNANFIDADLRKADLIQAYLDDTDLRGANLMSCILGDTTVVDVDLSEAKGLESVQHQYPSKVGIDTIYKSRASIPESFLRGCGIPDEFITYIHSLAAAGQPIRFYSCFISHSSKDQRFCDRLFADLQARGVRAWYFPEDARWGEPVWKEIDQSIKIYDKLVVVCSKHSLQSGPVLREIERSLNREDRENKNILFPVRIDNYIFDEWQHDRKDDVLRKVIGDFRKWRNPEAYLKAFDRLLRDLKAEEN